MHRNQMNVRVVEDEEDYLLRLRLEALQSLEDKLLKNKETTVNPKNDNFSPYGSNGDRLQYENWNENHKTYCDKSKETDTISWFQEQRTPLIKDESAYSPPTLSSGKSIKNVQLSPRSLAFVSQNMNILSKRKGETTPPYHQSPPYLTSTYYEDNQRFPSPDFSSYPDKYYKKSPSHREKDFKPRKRSRSRSRSISRSRSPYRSPGRHHSVMKYDRGNYSPNYPTRNWPSSPSSYNPRRSPSSPFFQSMSSEYPKSNINNRQKNNFKSNYKERNNYRNLSGSQANGRPRVRSRSRSVNQGGRADATNQHKISNITRNEKNSQPFSKQNFSYRSHSNKSRSRSPAKNLNRKETNLVTKSKTHENDSNNLESKTIRTKDHKDDENKLAKQESKTTKIQNGKEEINSSFTEKEGKEEEQQQDDDEESNIDDNDAVSLFTSDVSESENEGRFKLNPKKENNSINNAVPAPVLSFSNLGKSSNTVVKNLEELANCDKKSNRHNSYNSSSSNKHRHKSNGNHREMYKMKRMHDYEDKRRNVKGGRDNYKDRNNEHKSDLKYKQTFQSNRNNDKFKQKYKEKDSDRKNRNHKGVSIEVEFNRDKSSKNEDNHLGSSNSSNNKLKSSLNSRNCNIRLRLGEKRDKIGKSSRSKLLDKV